MLVRPEAAKEAPLTYWLGGGAGFAIRFAGATCGNAIWHYGY